MILYNSTFCIDEPLETEFVEFVKNLYIPEAYASGMYKGLLTKIRVPKEKNSLNGLTTVNYALQFRAPTEEICRNFTEEVTPRILESMSKNLQQGLNVYCTELDVIHDPDKNG